MMIGATVPWSSVAYAGSQYTVRCVVEQPPGTLIVHAYPLHQQLLRVRHALRLETVLAPLPNLAGIAGRSRNTTIAVPSSTRYDLAYPSQERPRNIIVPVPPLAAVPIRRGGISCADKFLYSHYS